MILIPAGNPSEWTGPGGNNTYLLTGAVPALIDAGVGHVAHIEAVARELRGDPLPLILVTHGHPDHVDGIPALLRRWPDARVRNVPGDACTPGEVVRAGDARLRAVHTPGHAPDHFCFLDEETREVYCGDLARLGGTVVVPASAGGHLAQYLESLRAIRAMAPRRLYPGHGPIVEDPAALIEHYLAHRHDREQQIVEALRSGCATPGAIAAGIYGALAPRLARAAEDSVLAHLIKLAEESRAAAADGRWRLTERRRPPASGT